MKRWRSWSDTRQWTLRSVLRSGGGTLPLTEPLPARRSHMPDPFPVGRGQGEPMAKSNHSFRLTTMRDEHAQINRLARPKIEALGFSRAGRMSWH